MGHFLCSLHFSTFLGQKRDAAPEVLLFSLSILFSLQLWFFGFGFIETPLCADLWTFVHSHNKLIHRAAKVNANNFSTLTH